MFRSITVSELQNFKVMGPFWNTLHIWIKPEFQNSSLQKNMLFPLSHLISEPAKENQHNLQNLVLIDISGIAESKIKQ